MSAPTEIAPEPSQINATDQPELPLGERLPREHRLLRRGEFVRIQQHGRRVHTAHFVVLFLRAVRSAVSTGAAGPAVRLGVTVGRRVGCAVQRNRIKRVVREVFRKNRALFPNGCDVVLVARPGADRLDYSSVVDELVRAQAAIERVRRQWSAEPEPASDP
jgi:ribonuclease P protein component